MSSFTLKIIAIITMLFDHAGYAVYGKLSWCNYIGRLAFPIFAFQITQGYIHTKNLKKYFLRLGIFALISQIPLMMLYSVFSNSFVFNIFFTLILGLLAITVLDKSENKVLGVIGALSIAFISNFLNVDYGIFGVLTIISFYIFKNNKLAMFLSFSALSIYNFRRALLLTHFRLDVVLLVIFTILSLLIIFLYNGKKGKNIKHLFYWFYPLHLIFLYLANILIFNKTGTFLNSLRNTFDFILRCFSSII